MLNDAIPSFYLYGEPHQAAAGGFVHVERLDDRSRPNGWMIRPHMHADLVQFLLIDTGGGVMQAEDRTLHFSTPVLLLVPAGVVHGFSWTDESTGWVLTLARSFLERIVDRHHDLAAVFAEPRATQPAQDVLVALRAGIEALRRELSWSVKGHHAAVEAALLTVMVSALRALPTDVVERATDPPGQHAALVARFRARIEERFRLRESVGAHADALGVSETSLRTACARIAAQSPAVMLDQRAMLEARRALLYTNKSVAEISYVLGFSDPAYFSRFFTRYARQSPRAFRQKSD